jgi:predicted acylesterase/phospholipase RssA
VGENNAYFDEKPLENALKNVIRQETKSENTPLAEDGNPSCPVFVVTTYGRIADGPLKLFKSYGFDKDPTPIWQAARATCAAAAFFPPARVTVPSPPGWYVDGGLRANNPSREAIVEGKKHWKARKCFIVSVGTGVQKPVDFIGKRTSATETPQSEPVQNAEPNVKVQQPDSKQSSKAVFGGLKEGLKKAGTKVGGTIKSAMTTTQPVTPKAAQITRIPGGVKVTVHIVKALVGLSTNSESTHRRVWEEANSQDESVQFPYFRFNVPRGMEEIMLEEWKKAEEVADMTRSYLGYPDVKEELRKCAEGLQNPSAFQST